MNELIFHHNYINGTAFDLSHNRNNGVPYAVTPAASPYAPAFSFATGDSRVIVNPNSTLEDLIAIRAVVTFYLAPSGGAITRRYNLMEGHLCYALFVQSDGSLMGTILDQTGNWLGAQSAPNTVTTGKWHQAEVRHDGINQCVIMLDGATVGTSYAARGPVGTVGPNGVAIGHWPETSGVYTFEGYIRETWLYKYDPLTAARSLIPKCCNYRAALDKTAQQLRAKGYTAAQASQQGMELIKFGLGLSAQARGSDPTQSAKHANLSQIALAAFMRGDSAAYTTALAQIAALSSGQFSQSDLEKLHAQEEALVKALPLPMAEWQRLIANMCLGKAKIDPQTLATEYNQFINQQKPSKPQQ